MDNLSLWFASEYRGERPRDPGSDGYNLGDFKAVLLFHLGASYQLNELFTINATVYNLFDKDFVDFREYTTGKYVNAYNNIYERRRLWLSATLSF